MDPVIVVLAVIAAVLLAILKRWGRRRVREAALAARERRTGSREPSTVGTYAVAAFFAAFGGYLLVFQTNDVTKGLPGWLTGSFLVVGSVVVAVTAPRRR